MNYDGLLELAGAKVLAYNSFGSYQGDWIAKVQYSGITGYIKDYYGSCSGCDALEAEFGFSSHECIGDDYYDPFYNGFKDECDKCQGEKKRAIIFGEQYLKGIISYEECLKDVSRNLEWDMEAQEMVDWLNKVENEQP